MCCAYSQNQRRACTCTHHALRFVFVKHSNGVRTFEFIHGAFDGIKQIAVVDAVDPMRNHFCVCLAGKHIAFGLQLRTQLVVVFNDAVVYQGDAARLVFQAFQAARA